MADNDKTAFANHNNELVQALNSASRLDIDLDELLHSLPKQGATGEKHVLKNAIRNVRELRSYFIDTIENDYGDVLRGSPTRQITEPQHTVRGETSEDGWPYGTRHDMDCPACVASGSSFTASPRSDAYWSN